MGIVHVQVPAANVVKVENQSYGDESAEHQYLVNVAAGEARWHEVKDSDSWQASPDPSVGLLYPSCLETRRRRRENQQLPKKDEDR